MQGARVCSFMKGSHGDVSTTIPSVSGPGSFYVDYIIEVSIDISVELFTTTEK